MPKGARQAAHDGAVEAPITPDTTRSSSHERTTGYQLSAPASGALLVAVLCAEVATYYRFSNSNAILMRGDPSLRHHLIMLTEWIRFMIFGAAAATILLSWTEFAMLAMRLLATPVAISRRKRIVAIQLMLAAALVAWSTLEPRFFASSESVAAWALVRIAIAIGATGAFAVALIPLEVWREWYSARPSAFHIGIVIGLVPAPVLRSIIPTLSTAMYEFTIWAAAAMLSALGQHPVVNWQRHSIAVQGFRVIISPQCSGIDGIVVIMIFLAAYLWVCRRSLRFPAALILFPVGVILSWLLNGVRLTALVLIGRHSPAISIEFFHTVAGWAFLNLLGVAIVVSSRSISVFRADPIDTVPTASERSTSADMYLLPMLVALAAGMLTRPFSSSLDWLYPVTVIATAAVLFVYRGEIVRLGWNPDWSTIGTGAVIFAIWIAIARWSGTLHDPAMAAGLQGLPGWQRCWWIAFRVAGAVVTVPIAEELCFRGYLLRKLVSAEFESVDPKRFTWLSFLLSSILFGVLHRNWIAGILAGMGFAIVVYRRGRLTDAIVAHSACNAMVAAYVILTNSWGLWN